jgi:hypothetical protein
MHVQIEFLRKFYTFIWMAETLLLFHCYVYTNKTELNSWPFPVTKINIMPSICLSNAPGIFYDLIYTDIIFFLIFIVGGEIKVHLMAYCVSTE